LMHEHELKKNKKIIIGVEVKVKFSKESWFS
jgi:hypothetical protein